MGRTFRGVDRQTKLNQKKWRKNRNKKFSMFYDVEYREDRKDRYNRKNEEDRYDKKTYVE